MSDPFDAVALQVPTILLPAPNADWTRWAVVACDQYTSQPEYWAAVDEFVGDVPSTLRLIFPEVFLEEPGGEARIEAIQSAMELYCKGGILAPRAPGFVLLDRATAHAPSRKGLVVALDLEQYDFEKGATTLIRATEGTIIDRLPPRIKVRENAPVELPHIMVLIDDPQRTVIEPLFGQVGEPIYDFDLMQDSGHLTGWLVDDAARQRQIAEALADLIAPGRMAEKYDAGEADGAPLLYAMGDGNHSFATAKAIWDRLKAEAPDPGAIMNHPARHALVELVNVHDEGLTFEPIHRVCFDIDVEKLLAAATAWFAERDQEASVALCDTPGAAQAAAAQAPAGAHAIPFVHAGGAGVLTVAKPALTLVVATLQAFLDDYLAAQGGRVDYIHGEAVVSELGTGAGCIGFYLPGMEKSDLFKTVLHDGALPRKTFSMGEADEKRFYVEARAIQ